MSSLALRTAIALSVLLGVLRLHLAGLVGFGDAEALYVSYALHPAPAYLDHPGFVGVLARLIGGSGTPTPEMVHRFTALAATALPWVGFFAARNAGASADAALRSFFALALLPEASIGLFGLTPDLPLCFAWLATIGLSALALRKTPGSFAALAAFLGAGAAAAVAVLSKASGALLPVALVVAFVPPGARAHRRTIAPYLGLALMAILVAPLVSWEAERGYPLLYHRLVATQRAAGFSVRNLGALLGGQLAYVTPPLLAGAYFALRDLLRRRRDPVDWLLLVTAVGPGVVLTLLCLWSRVAEPHWVAPAYLSLAIGASRSAPRPKLDLVCLATGVVVSIAAWALVTTPLFPRLAGSRYVARYDLTNDLFAWRTGIPLVASEIEGARQQSSEPVVVGPHWTICAQLHAALGLATPVGCRTPVGDDFRIWYPESTWTRARTVVFVTDDRFPSEPERLFPDRDLVSVRSATVFRGGRAVRTIRVSRLELSASALARKTGHSAAVAGSRVRPAARSNSESPSGPGFGVVSSRSP